MTDFLLIAFIFLFAGIVTVPLASRLGLGSVLGYLIAGIVISPALVLLEVDIIAVQHFAEFGVVMMLFLIGLELEPKLLWSMRARLLGLGGTQALLTAVALGGAAMLLGQDARMALAIGLVLTLSSTAIVLQTLTEKGWIRCDGGQASFSVLLFQDIAVIPMIALIPLLAAPELLDLATASTGGDHGSGSLNLVEHLPGWARALATFGAIGAVIAAGTFLTRPIFRFVSAANLRELFVAAALLFVIGIALLMSLVGLSPALGTFLAGVVLANSEYRHELEANIDPFKGLLLGLFFITVGAGVNFGLLFERPVTLVGLTVGLMALKALILFALSLKFKITGADRWMFTLGLAQAGEFGFVLLALSESSGVIPRAVSDQLLLIVALSMLLTPALFILYERVIAPRFAVAETRESDVIDQRCEIIIAGHGRVGGIVSRIMRGAGFNPTVIDYSSRQLEIIRAFKLQAYFGDATRPDLLRAAGIDEAKLFVIAIDDKDQITELVRHCTRHHPQLHVIARAITRDHVYDLYFAGCRDIIRETYDSSLRMGRSAFEALGYSRDQSERMVDSFNETDRSMMLRAAQHYDPALPLIENQEYIDEVNVMRGDWEAQLRAKMTAIMSEGKDP